MDSFFFKSVVNMYNSVAESAEVLSVRSIGVASTCSTVARCRMKKKNANSFDPVSKLMDWYESRDNLEASGCLVTIILLYNIY